DPHHGHRELRAPADRRPTLFDGQPRRRRDRAWGGLGLAALVALPRWDVRGERTAGGDLADGRSADPRDLGGGRVLSRHEHIQATGTGTSTGTMTTSAPHARGRNASAPLP